MSSSLDKILENIIRENKEKAEQIRKQALSEADEMLANERMDATREADQIIRSAKSEADAEKNRRISQAKQEARLLYLAEKNKVVRGLLDDLRSTLVKFAENDSSYRRFLVNAIARGVEAVPSDTVKVAVSERDARRFRAAGLIEEALAMARVNKKATLSDQPLETMGGAVITSEDYKMKADCTFEARLELMEPQLLAEISKIIFAP